MTYLEILFVCFAIYFVTTLHTQCKPDVPAIVGMLILSAVPIANVIFAGCCLFVSTKVAFYDVKQAFEK